ncbi:MAG: hypothetical protein Ct9H90mP28_5890 [Paracoccaceae bacterium]|nr:MAG: hypothetical protein Ct9H90mP28_5890 [Paracoccaceae bacterium]
MNQKTPIGITKTLDEALPEIVNPNGPEKGKPDTYVLYISPIIGGISEGDVISIFVNNENRGEGIIAKL